MEVQPEVIGESETGNIENAVDEALEKGLEPAVSHSLTLLLMFFVPTATLNPKSTMKVL